MQARQWAVWTSLLALLVACKTEEVKRCHSEMASAQLIVNDIDSSSLDSVKKGLGAVDQALATCRQAGRDDEVAELTKARAQIEAHIEALRLRAESPGRKKLTAQELERLIAKGDPECPKGQAYTHQESGKEIRCAGPQLVDMSFAQAKDYLERRGLKRLPSAPNVLTGEYGAERLEFRFDKADDAAPPKCVVLHPKPGVTWQEATARATGVHPDKLEAGGTVRARRGERRLVVDAKRTIVKIGQCG